MPPCHVRSACQAKKNTLVMKCCESASSNLATASQTIAWQLQMQKTHQQNLNPSSITEVVGVEVFWVSSELCWQRSCCQQKSQAGRITDPSSAACCHCQCKQHWKGKIKTLSLLDGVVNHSSKFLVIDHCVCVANSRLIRTFPRIHYCCTQNCRLACHCEPASKKGEERQRKVVKWLEI